MDRLMEALSLGDLTTAAPPRTATVVSRNRDPDMDRFGSAVPISAGGNTWDRSRTGPTPSGDQSQKFVTSGIHL